MQHVNSSGYHDKIRVRSLFVDEIKPIDTQEMCVEHEEYAP